MIHKFYEIDSHYPIHMSVLIRTKQTAYGMSRAHFEG